MEPNPKLKLNLELPTDWSKIKTSSGKSFDDLFHLDNIPLSWIYQRIFLPHVIPKPLTKKYKDENNKLTKLFLRKRRNITAKIIAKYIQYNESRKYIISQKNKEQKNDLQTKIKKCLILTYLNHYENREGVQKIARIQGIIDHLKQYNSRKKNFEKNNLKEDNLSDENLKKDKLETYLIFADRLSSQPTDEKKVKLNTIYNHIDQENITKAQKKAREMYRLWKNIYQKEIETIISEENKSLWDYYNPIFTLYFSKEFLYLTILYYETFKKVIEKENIAVIVTTAQNGLFERCCFAAAKTKNIPTLFIQHGIGTISGKPELFLDNTHLAVFGPNIKKELVKSGINQNKITATGPVVYDEIIKYSKNQKKENKNK